MTLSRIAEAFDPDVGDYPTRWPDFIGQADAVSTLRVAAKSAKIRKDAIDHIVLAGPPGMGKTALAGLVAREMGTECFVVSGQLSRIQAGFMFTAMKDRDVLVYDEFHQVMNSGKKGAEWLLHYLQDGVLSGPTGFQKVPRVSFVGTTTEPHKLPEAIRDRTMIVTLEDYSDSEAGQVAQKLGVKVLGAESLPGLDSEQAVALARGGNGNPRKIRMLLKTLRDLVLCEEITGYDIPALLAWKGLTEDGLDKSAREYLRILFSEFQGKTGKDNMAGRMHQNCEEVEELLQKKGLIAKTHTGREITLLGMTRIATLEAA